MYQRTSNVAQAERPPCATFRSYLAHHLTFRFVFIMAAVAEATAVSLVLPLAAVAATVSRETAAAAAAAVAVAAGWVATVASSAAVATVHPLAAAVPAAAAHPLQAASAAFTVAVPARPLRLPLLLHLLHFFFILQLFRLLPPVPLLLFGFVSVAFFSLRLSG